MKSVSVDRIHSHDTAAREKLELKDVVRNILEESRMVLPGIQALFGFQLIAVFNAKFEQLSVIDKNLHLAAIFLTICAIGLVIAPAAYHRHAERNTVSQHLADYASKLLCLGMWPLMFSLCIDTYVVSNVITANTWAALTVSVTSFVILLVLWFVIPHLAHKNR